MTDVTVYQQRRDPWFHMLTVLFTALVVCFVVLGLIGSDVTLLIVGFVFAVILAAAILPNYFLGRYELGESSVHVRFYLTDLTIPYRDIISTGPASGWKSTVKTVATSLKMVEIQYRDGGHNRYISFAPADRDGFVRELGSRIAQK